jgi:hypothetical protein
MSKCTESAAQAAPGLSPELIARLAKCDPYAVRCLADWAGPCYFNPMIGSNPTETFESLNDALGFLHGLMVSDDGLNIEHIRGLSLFVQSMWTAAQYEAFRQKNWDCSS